MIPADVIADMPVYILSAIYLCKLAQILPKCHRACMQSPLCGACTKSTPTALSSSPLPQGYQGYQTQVIVPGRSTHYTY